MLKERVLTAVVLLPLLIGAIFLLPPLAFSAIAGAILLIGAWEWSNLMGLKDVALRVAYTLFAALCMLAVFQSGLVEQINWISVAFWPIAFALILSYPKSQDVWNSHWAVRAIIGLIVVVPTFASIAWIQAQSQGAWLLVYAMVVVFAADTGAYFAGKNFGRHKLAPKVSPGKTIEGFIGGMVSAAIFAAAVSAIQGWQIQVEVLLALGMAVVSVVGDLFESMLKRTRGIKDSSNILPGHGGILDRIDSLGAALPLFVAISAFLGLR